MMGFSGDSRQIDFPSKQFYTSKIGFGSVTFAVWYSFSSLKS